MKLYKFISEDRIERYDKKYVYLDGVQISNPSLDTLLKANIKPLEEGVKPDYNEEIQLVQPYYVNKDNTIKREWKVCDIQFEEVTDDEFTSA